MKNFISVSCQGNFFIYKITTTKTNENDNSTQQNY